MTQITIPDWAFVAIVVYLIVDACFIVIKIATAILQTIYEKRQAETSKRVIEMSVLIDRKVDNFIKKHNNKKADEELYQE